VEHYPLSDADYAVLRLIQGGQLSFDSIVTVCHCAGEAPLRAGTKQELLFVRGVLVLVMSNLAHIQYGMDLAQVAARWKGVCRDAKWTEA
jgi:hypothetical protein